MKIAIQGIRGAFHETAAEKFFSSDPSMEIVPCLTFEELVEQKALGKVDYAIMAIENSIAGTIHHNYELIRKHHLKQIGEVNLPVKQNLFALPGTSINDLKQVSSHYMALDQCRDYFTKYPDIKLIESPDTALSVKQVAQDGITSNGAIGSELAGTYYGLELIAQGIESDKANITRFAVFGDQYNTKGRKISISIILKHQSGSLAHLLSALHDLRVNLTKIESLPIQGKPFNYRFILDFELNDDWNYEAVMLTIGKHTVEKHFIGRYDADDHLVNTPISNPKTLRSK